MKCYRCKDQEGIYAFKLTDDYGEVREGKLCWNCDFDVSNGKGEITDDSGEVAQQREEEECDKA
jgi:hypothetical protein